MSSSNASSSSEDERNSGGRDQGDLGSWGRSSCGSGASRRPRQSAHDRARRIAADEHQLEVTDQGPAHETHVLDRQLRRIEHEALQIATWIEERGDVGEQPEAGSSSFPSQGLEERHDFDESAAGSDGQGPGGFARGGHGVMLPIDSSESP